MSRRLRLAEIVLRLSAQDSFAVAGSSRQKSVTACLLRAGLLLRRTVPSSL
jgi:hypothetical protein